MNGARKIANVVTDVPNPMGSGDVGALQGRRAAGEDPRKRDQILEGAKRVFMKSGFDAATMNDITREAQVSKGTIYVYFNNKEDLFAALIERERSRMVASMRSALSGDGPVADSLFNFGFAFASHVLKPGSIYAMRMVIGVIDRMPQLADRFFTTGPDSVRYVIETFLAERVEKGHLVIDDIPLAAVQFIEMSTAGLHKPRLFGHRVKEATVEEMQHTIRGAVRVFLAAYGVKAA